MLKSENQKKVPCHNPDLAMFFGVPTLMMVQDLIERCLERRPEQRITLEQIKQHPWLNSDPSPDQLIHQMSSLKIREKSAGDGNCCGEKDTTFEKNSIVGWEKENNSVQDVNNKKRNGENNNKKQGKFNFFGAKGKTASTFENNKIAGENNRMLSVNNSIQTIQIQM